MVFYAFDLAYLNGYDLTAVPLVQRKALLEKLLAPVVGDTSAIQLSDHVVGNGAALFERASEMGSKASSPSAPTAPTSTAARRPG